MKKNLIYVTIFCLNFFFFNHHILCQIQEINLVKPIAVLGSNAENAPPEQSFYWPLSVNSDNSGNVYILDSGNQRIVKFDKNFQFIKEFGRQGQGPGEFSFRPGMINSGTMTIYKNKIYVVDNNVRRVQIFSVDGNYLNSFHIFSTSSSIGHDKQNNIFINSITGGENGHLVHVYNPKGDFKYSFAKKIIEKPLKRFLLLNETSFCFTSENQIFLGFVHFPIIRKYNKKGTKLFEKNIDFSSTDAKNMAKSKKYFDITPKIFNTKPNDKLFKIIIEGIQPASNGGCYVLISNRIFLLDANGNTVKIFTITNKEMPIFRFAVNEKQQRLYALDTVRNHRLVIYDLKK